MGNSSSSTSHGKINKKLILLVFSFFLLVNIASSGGHVDVFDGTETFLVAESMVLKHSAKLYADLPSVKGIPFDIHWSQGYSPDALLGKLKKSDLITLPPFYTLRSLLLSAIAVPFYYAATILSISPVNVVGLFVNPLIISLTSLVIFCFSFEVYRSRKIAFVLGLVYGVCSFVWPYNTSLWPQPLQALCIIASAFFIFKSIHNHHQQFSFRPIHYTRPNNKNNKGIYYAGVGGLFLGLSVFAHPTSVILIPAFALYSIVSMRHNIKSLASFFFALAITLSFMGVVNYLRFGSFTEFGYGLLSFSSSFSQHSSWIGLVGLLVSPGAGLIFFFPIAILLPLAFKYMYRENKGLFFLSAYVIIVTWLYVGTIPGDPFWGGGAWGPRYLIPVLPFITIVSGALLTHLEMYHSKRRLLMKISIIALCTAGFLVNLFGKIVWIFYVLLYTLGIQPSHMGLSDPYYSPVILQLKTLMSGYVTHINPELYISAGFWSSLHQGLAPCPVDVYLFCKFGIAPILLLSAIIVTLAVLIGMEISKFNPRTFVIQLKAIKLSHLLQK